MSAKRLLIHFKFLWILIVGLCLLNCHKTLCRIQLEVDWIDNASVCAASSKWTTEDILYAKPYSFCNDIKDISAYHVPLNKPINTSQNHHLPNNGAHREKWAVNGEYDYVPPGRFVHNIEHGGAAFMYHPCAPTKLVEAFKNLSRQCTWRHLIFAYPFVLNQSYPLGIVTWGCEYRMSRINVTDIQLFMQQRIPSFESEIKRGSYNFTLKHESVVKSGMNASSNEFCKNITEYWELSVTARANLQTTLPEAPTKTPRNKQEAIWAVGSLSFILICLAVAVCYTQLWKKGNHGESFEKSRIWSDESEPGSISVAAIVRKFPNMVRSKLDRVRATRISRDARYHRIIEDDQSYSEDEI